MILIILGTVGSVVLFGLGMCHMVKNDV